jgi:hypothetical protein
LDSGQTRKINSPLFGFSSFFESATQTAVIRYVELYMQSRMARPDTNTENRKTPSKPKTAMQKLGKSQLYPTRKSQLIYFFFLSFF